MSTPNEKAIRRATLALERAARDYRRVWSLWIDDDATSTALTRAEKKLHQAAIKYTREIDKGRR